MKAVTPRSVFDSAALALHFGAASPPFGYTLTAYPPVRMGVSLASDEVERSRMRGGDGMAAALDGGVVVVVADPGTARIMQQNELSFLLRARDPSGRWRGPLACELDPDGKPRFSLSASETMLVFSLFTDYREQPLEMTAPFSLIGAERWHDIVGRYSGPHVELFVDGALVDEDWPIGFLAGGGRGRVLIGACGDTQGQEGFHGLLDHLAAWDRALSDAEIEALCGGAGQIAARGWELPSSTGVQYRTAPGGGFVGDCFPFFHDGVYHFYYLFDRRHHRSKFGLGAHQWAHASSEDLVHWQHHPLAIAITDEREGSICTGSMFFHDGTWYAFYATRLPDRSEHVSLAVGPDGIHFTKTEENPLASPQPPYRYGPFRDPHVFRDPATGLFHMLVTAELEHPPVAGRGGCLAHLMSSDLRHWKQKGPFLVTGYGDQPECSELFAWRGWYYLVFSHFGAAHYRMGRDLLGPWTKPRVDCFDGPLARVMKTAAFTEDRRIGAFFLADDGYAGRAVFRELVQNPDGSLGSTWPPEMVPRTGPLLSPGFEAMGQRVSGDPSSIHIESPQGFSAATLSGLPGTFMLSFRVRTGGPASVFGVGISAGIGGSGDFRSALVLEFDPCRRKVGWRRAGQPSWQEEETAALYEVDGLEKPFSVQIIVLGEVIDVCIDRRRTLINRAHTAVGDRLYFYCHESTVDFEEIAVRPLVDTL